MFAPKVAKPQTKTAEGPTTRLATRYSTLVGHRLSHDPVEKCCFFNARLEIRQPWGFWHKGFPRYPETGATEAMSTRVSERIRQPRHHFAASCGISARCRCFHLSEQAEFSRRSHPLQHLSAAPYKQGSLSQKSMIRLSTRRIASPTRCCACPHLAWLLRRPRAPAAASNALAPVVGLARTAETSIEKMDMRMSR